MSSIRKGRRWPWIAFTTLLAVTLVAGGAYLVLRPHGRAEPGVTDLVFQLASNGKVTCQGKTFHDPPTRDFRHLDDVFESRRQGRWRTEGFVNYTIFVDADPEASWRHLYEVWSRAIRDGAVTSMVLRVPDLKEEARVTFPRRAGPPPPGLPEVRLMVRDRTLDPGRSYLPIPYVTLSEVATAEGAVGAFHPKDEGWNLSLAARAAARVMKEVEKAGAGGKPARVLLDFEEDTPARRVVILLAALDRAGAGDVELAEPRR